MYESFRGQARRQDSEARPWRRSAPEGQRLSSPLYGGKYGEEELKNSGEERVCALGRKRRELQLRPKRWTSARTGGKNGRRGYQKYTEIYFGEPARAWRKGLPLREVTCPLP